MLTTLLVDLEVQVMVGIGTRHDGGRLSKLNLWLPENLGRAAGGCSWKTAAVSVCYPGNHYTCVSSQALGGILHRRTSLRAFSYKNPAVVVSYLI